MALAVASGSFVTPTVTGQFAVTGVGFQGKVLLLFGGQLPDPLAATPDLRIFAGAATSATNRIACGACADDALATSAAGRTQLIDRAYRETFPTTNTYLDLDFVSWDADGFTLDVVSLHADAVLNPKRVFYLILGGADLTHAQVGTFDTGTVTGALGVTGVGFQPDLLLLMTAQHTRTSPTVEGNIANAAFSLGVARSPTARWTYGLALGTGSGNPHLSDFGVFRSDAALIQCDPLASGIDGEFDLDSFDADGFTVDRVVVRAAQTRGLLYVALKGTYRAALGTFTQRNGAGTQAVTGVGFQPSALLFGSASKAVNGTITAKGQGVLGAALGPTNRRVVAASSNSTDPSQADTTGAEDACLIHLTAGTPTIDAQADLDSMDADGFTLNWSEADAVARASGFLALASEADGAITGALATTLGPLTVQATGTLAITGALAQTLGPLTLAASESQIGPLGPLIGVNRLMGV